jgi:hypothetical protein
MMKRPQKITLGEMRAMRILVVAPLASAFAMLLGGALIVLLPADRAPE